MVVEKELRNTLFLSRYLCIKILVCDLIDTEHSIRFFEFVKCFLGKKSKKIWKQHGNFKINSEAKIIHISLLSNKPLEAQILSSVAKSLPSTLEAQVRFLVRAFWNCKQLIGSWHIPWGLAKLPRSKSTLTLQVVTPVKNKNKQTIRILKILKMHL